MAVDEPPPNPHSAPTSHGPLSEEDDMAIDEPQHGSAPTSHGPPLLEEEEDVRVMDPPPPPKPRGGGRGADTRQWSAEVEQMKSSLDRKKLLQICRQFGISEVNYTAFCPEDGWGPCKTPPEGSACVYKVMLEVGVRFPLHDFYTKVLGHYRIAPSQLTPMSWRYLVGFVLVCDGAGIKPTLSIFQYYFKLKATPGSKLRGWYSFTPHPGPSYQDGPSRRFFSAAPADCYSRKLDGWKKMFFFLESRSAETAWRCPTKWGKPSQHSLKDPVLKDAAKENIKKLEPHTGKSLRSLLSKCEKFPVLLAPVKDGPTSPRRKMRPVASIIDPPPEQLPVAMASPPPPPPPPESITPEPDPDDSPDRDSQRHSFSQMLMDASVAVRRTETDLRRLKDGLQEEKSKHAADVARFNKELGAAKAEHTAQVAKLSAEKRQLMEKLNAEKSRASQLAEDFRMAEAKHAAEVKALNDEWQRKVTTDARRQSGAIICAALRETRSAVVKAIDAQLLANYPCTEPAIQTPPPGFLPRQELQAPVAHAAFHQTMMKKEVEARQGTEGTKQTMEDLMMTRCPSTKLAILTPEAPEHQ